MIKRLQTIGIFSTIFFTSHVLFKSPFEFYIPYAVIILLLPSFALKYAMPSQLFPILIPLLISGLFSVNMGDNQMGEFFKIFLNISISLSFYFYVIQFYEFNIYEVFSYYMQGSFYMSLLGFSQIISKIIGFRLGYDYTWLLNKWNPAEGGILGVRVSALFSEPSYFGGTIGAAFFVALYNLMKNKEIFITRFQSISICAAYILTTSSVAFFGVFVAIVVLLINYGFVRYVLIVGPLLGFGYFYAYNNVAEFRDRIDGIDKLNSGEVTKAWQVHGSSFVQFNNQQIATKNLAEHPLFGTGLGSHQFAYEKYSLTKTWGGIYNFNKQDANSMALRLMSETGLYGLVVMFIFIYRFFIKRLIDNSDDYLWLISGACFVAIMLQLLRQGNYTYNGFMLFIWLYYFAYKKRQEELIAKSEIFETEEEDYQINNLQLQ